MELRSGYKQTEVGIVPSDWDVGLVGDLATKVGSGITPLGGKRVYREFGRPFVRSQNVGWGELHLHDVAFIDDNLHATFPETEIRADDILLNITGASIGRSALADSQLAGGNVNQHVCIIRTSPKHTNVKFLNLVLLSAIGQRQIDSFQAGGNREGLNFSQVRSLKIPLPPNVAEQSAIAEALGDVDALLSSLDALIAKKRDLKQAAMQQLLTGKTRLPGFSGGWEVKRLGDFVSIRNQKVMPALVAPETLCVELEHVSQGGGRLLTRGAADNSTASKFRFQAGDVLFGRLRSYLRKYWLSAEDGICTTEIWPLMFDGAQVSARFVFAIVQTNAFIEAASVSYGTHMPRADWGVIRNFEVHLPRLEEQAAIAEVLSDMDSELAALEAQREKTRLLKQGMMQELLTGRTRLVVPAAETPTARAQVIEFPTRKPKPDSEAVQPEGKAEAKKANVHFIRSVLAAEIIDRLHEEPTFGHVKCEKVIYFADRMCKVDTGSHYHRDAAGPYDNRALRSIDSQLKKQQWFEVQKDGQRYRYVPLSKRGGHRQYFDRYFGNVRSVFERIIDTFRPMTTEQCEIVATLFEAWHDLLGRQAPVSDDAIVHEVLNNWHESKKRIDEDRWRKALGWMKEQGFVPMESPPP